MRQQGVQLYERLHVHERSGLPARRAKGQNLRLSVKAVSFLVITRFI